MYGIRLSVLKVRVNRTLSILILTSTSFFSYGQGLIEGRVTDQQQGLLAASVFLLGLDSTFIQGVATDSTGKFIFEIVIPGDYLISVHTIGYSRYYSLPVRAGDNHRVLPDIRLKEDPAVLAEILITGEREMIGQKLDRVVFDIGSSITSSGNTVLELLQKSAGVVVNRQSNVISINGRTGATVMINGKPIQLLSDALIQMLDGMNAANVEKIELITSPEARFDAEGGGGIIHIVTKEDPDMGTGGLFAFTAGASWAETLSGNFSINHRTKYFSCFADYSLTRRHNLHILNTKQTFRNTGFNRSVTGYSHRENVTRQQNLRSGFEWELNSKTLLSFVISAYRRNWTLRADTDESNYATADSTIVTHMRIAESNIWQSAAGTVGLHRKMNTKGEFALSLDYLYYDNNNPSRYNVDSYYEESDLSETSSIDLAKNTPIHFFVSRADYHHQAGASLSWEAGLKSVYTVLSNDVSVQRNTGQGWITDPTFSSSSLLNETIGAGYVSSKWTVNDQLEINGGLRYEFTRTSISSRAQQDLVSRRYGYLFPNFSVRKSLGVEKELRFSYARRITRPSYNDIAPYVFFWGPHSFSAGNTQLYPATADAVTAGYQLKQWTVSLHFTHSRNEITSLQPGQDSLSNLIYRSQNLKSLKTTGITNSYSAAISTWWDIQGTITAQYQVGRSSHLPVNFTSSLLGLNVTLINRLRLPKAFSIEVSALYQSRSISGISEFFPMGSLNAGVQKNFGKRGRLQLSMDDILYTNNWWIRTNSADNDLVTFFQYDWHNQFIRLSYTRSLGNLMMRPAEKRRGAEEERRRVE